MLGFILSQVLISKAFDSLSLRRGTSFLHVIRGLKKIPNQEIPTLLLLGSSYTSRNIDGDSLENKLSVAGLDFKIHQMSYPGSYAYEQDFYLEQYLLDFPVPDIVLIELGTEHSLIIKPENFLKHQTIDYMDYKRTKVIFQNLWAEQSDTVFDKLITIGKHGLAKSVHLGIFHSFEPKNPGPEKSGFVPEVLGNEYPKAEEVKSGLLAKVNRIVANDFRVQFRTKQFQYLLDQGVKSIIYWQPPSIDIEQRMRTGSLCVALQFQCIAFDEPDLLNGLFWTDRNHLDRRGAELLTGWLARRLIRNKDINNVI